MTQTNNYELNIVEGSDVVNPLIQTNPNFQTIDTVMKANETMTVGNATEVKSGTNHAISRAKTNTNAFRFVATSDYRTGDTFSVDGNTVTASLVDGSNPKDRAFVIGTAVVCILENGRLTLVGCESEINIGANAVTFDTTGTNLSETNVEDVIKEVNNKTKEFHVVNFNFSAVGDFETWLYETISGLWYITGTYAINQYGAYFDNFGQDLYDVAGSYNGTETTISAKAIGNNYIGGYAHCYVVLQRA